MYTAGNRRQAVTELMLPGGTMSMQWIAKRPGNWLFHCHFGFHVSHYLSLHKIVDPVDPDSPVEVEHSADGMAGLVLGITVKGKAASSPPALKQARRIRLFMQARPVPGKAPLHHYAFIEQRGSLAPAPDSVPETSQPLLLRRGEPVAITIMNRLPYPSAVHWHGIELGNSDAAACRVGAAAPPGPCA